MKTRLLIVETSHRRGHVALAAGAEVLSRRWLDESRRHARDLVPFLQEMLDEQGWKARELNGVIVSQGPGSYTGLRVGIMSAKTLAYASGCRLLGIPTFAALAEQTPMPASRVEVIADAQQDKIYHQGFARTSDGWTPASELKVLPWAEWLPTLPAESWVTGPGLEGQTARFPPGTSFAPEDRWHPLAESFLTLGTARFERGENDNVFALEPLYMRPSSAEEKWNSR